MPTAAPRPRWTSNTELRLGACLALLCAVAILYANVMNVVILGMHDKLGLSMQAAGDISSLNLLGVAVGALLAACLPRRLVRLPVALACLGALLLLDLASMTLQAMPLLALARALHGLAGGGLLAFCGAALARRQAPERIMGASLALQLALASAAARYLPPVVLAHGPAPVFGIMAALELLALALLWRQRQVLADAAAQAGAAPARWSGAGARLARHAVLLTASVLLALLLFQGARFMLVGYGFQVGDLFGHARSRSGAVISVANWFAGCGALLAALLPLRWGRARPLLLAAFGNLAASVALICWGAQPLVFAVATCAVALFTFIALPFHYGVCFALDRSGRLGIWTGFISKTGLALGPSLGAFLMQRHGLLNLMELSAALVCLATLLACGAAVVIDARA